MTTTNLPERIDRYEIERKLSEGGMAEVFLAHRDVAGVQRRVVVKSVLPDFLSDTKFVAMMLNEARIAVGLSHPSIVKVEDLIEVDGRPFIVMEYLDGQNLREILSRAVKNDCMLSLPFCCAVLANVLDGLDHAHDRADEQGNTLGLVHRDVSLANVIVTWTGEVKLIDFGIAKATSLADQDLTRVGQRKGKCSYMAPEQVRREPIDRRADLFSAGVVLWEMLTRRRLFSRRSEIDSMIAICGEPAPAPSSVNPAVPPELDAICLKALARNRDDRYQTAGAMLDDLTAFMNSQGWTTGSQATHAQLASLFPAESAAACAPRPEKHMALDDWEDVPETIPLKSGRSGYVRVQAGLPDAPGQIAPEVTQQMRAASSAEILLLNQPAPGPSVYDDLYLDGSTVPRRPSYTPLLLLALGVLLMLGAMSTVVELRAQPHTSNAASLTGPTATPARPLLRR